MKDILETIERWQADGERFALATVINVDGSAPRDEGATMLISESGKIAGSVSGGCVEGAVVEEARSVLAGGPPKIVRYGINKNMMWDVGLSCGGAIDVFIDRFAGPPQSADIEAIRSRSPRSCADPRMSVLSERWMRKGRSGSTGDPALDARIDDLARGTLGCGIAKTGSAGAHDVFVEPLLPDPRLIIVGAVHIAVALCDLAATVWIRGDRRRPARPPEQPGALPVRPPFGRRLARGRTARARAR